MSYLHRQRAAALFIAANGLAVDAEAELADAAAAADRKAAALAQARRDTVLTSAAGKANPALAVQLLEHSNMAPVEILKTLALVSVEAA
jgi:hypothetical protein